MKASSYWVWLSWRTRCYEGEGVQVNHPHHPHHTCSSSLPAEPQAMLRAPRQHCALCCFMCLFYAAIDTDSIYQLGAFTRIPGSIENSGSLAKWTSVSTGLQFPGPQRHGSSLDKCPIFGWPSCTSSAVSSGSSASCPHTCSYIPLPGLPCLSVTPDISLQAFLFATPAQRDGLLGVPLSILAAQLLPCAGSWATHYG